MTNHELWKLFVRIINNIPQPSCIVLFSAVLVIIYSSGEFNTFLHHHLDKPDPHWRMSHTNKKVLSTALCNFQKKGWWHRKQKICQNSFTNKIFICWFWIFPHNSPFNSSVVNIESDSCYVKFHGAVESVECWWLQIIFARQLWTTQSCVLNDVAPLSPAPHTFNLIQDTQFHPSGHNVWNLIFKTTYPMLSTHLFIRM